MSASRIRASLALVLSLSAAGVAFSAALAMTAAAQDTPAPAKPTATGRVHAAPDPQKQTARLSRKLQLTPDQASKIEPIIQTRQQQVAQLRGNSSLAPRDLHQKMRALKQDTDSQIQAILTDSQRQQYLQMQQAAVQKHRQSKQATGAPKAGDSADDDGAN